LVLEGFEDEGRYLEVAVSGALPEARGRNVRFETAALKGVELAGGRLPGLGMADCRLVDCNASNLRARDADLARVAFERCRLTGIELTEGAVQDVVFRGCKLDMASFGFARLVRVQFDDCVLTRAEFLEASLSSVRFDGCDLSGADLRGATMRSCELRRCTLTEVVGVERLRGAALEWPAIVEHAGVWAAALGIGVLDE
jgi:uncharacterized protein YjbI with pentapeptide repeats